MALVGYECQATLLLLDTLLLLTNRRQEVELLNVKEKVSRQREWNSPFPETQPKRFVANLLLLCKQTK